MPRSHTTVLSTNTIFPIGEDELPLAIHPLAESLEKFERSALGRSFYLAQCAHIVSAEKFYA